MCAIRKMEVVKALLSDDPAMLLRESVCPATAPMPWQVALNIETHLIPRIRIQNTHSQMGVGADGSQKAFASVDVRAFMERTVVDMPSRSCDDLPDACVNHIVIAVCSARPACACVCVVENSVRAAGRSGWRGCECFRRLKHRAASQRIRRGEMLAHSVILTRPHLS